MGSFTERNRTGEKVGWGKVRNYILVDMERYTTAMPRKYERIDKRSKKQTSCRSGASADAYEENEKVERITHNRSA
jgi:hypothetical protein